MVNKYFTVDVIPDIVHGDISDVYASNVGVDLDTSDLISDWTAVDVPKGVNILHSISLLVNNEDAGAGYLTLVWVGSSVKKLLPWEPAPHKGGEKLCGSSDGRRPSLGGREGENGSRDD